MHEELESEIRAALLKEADAHEAPPDLALRTLVSAEMMSAPNPLHRLRAWRDARRAGAGHTRTPRWAAPAKAFAMLALFFLVGRMATGPTTPALRPEAAPAPTGTQAPTPGADAGRGGSATLPDCTKNTNSAPPAPARPMGMVTFSQGARALQRVFGQSVDCPRGCRGPQGDAWRSTRDGGGGGSGTLPICNQNTNGDRSSAAAPVAPPAPSNGGRGGSGTLPICNQNTTAPTAPARPMGMITLSQGARALQRILGQSCSAGARGGNPGDGGRTTGGSGGSAFFVPDVSGGPSGQPSVNSSTAAASGSTVAPQLAHNVDLEVQIRRGSFDARWRRANEVATRHGGFVTASAAEVARERIARGTLTLRVPSDQLDQTVADFRGLGTLVRMNQAGRDVGGQLTDFDARIRNAQAQEAQLLELIKQSSRATDVADVRGRLDAVRQEIEQIQGRRAALQGQVDLATLQVVVSEPGVVTQPKSETRLGRAWSQAADGVLTIVAGALVAAGFAGPVVVLVLLAWWFGRRLLWRPV